MSNRDLHRLVVGNAVSTLGNAVYLIAVTLLLKELTQSPFMLGAFQFLALLPGFVLSPLTGALIDRLPRRSIVIWSDLARGVLMIGAGMLLFWPPFVHPAALLLVSLGAGVGHAFFVPAAQALVPALVPAERLQHANGLRAAGSQVANLAGNAVGGAMYTLLGAPVLLVLNGVSFLLSAAQERRIRSVDAVSTAGGTGQSVAAAAREGLQLLRRERSLRLLIASQAGLFFVSPVLMLALPFVVIDELGHPPAVVGFMFSLALAGGIVGFGLLRRLPVDRMLRLPLVSGAYAAITGVFALLAVTTTTVALGTAALIFGLSSGTVYLTAVTWIQRRIPANLHGRTFALLEAVSSLVAPVSYLAAGIVLEGLGSSRRWIAFAVLAGAGGLWTLITAFHALRRRDSGSNTPPRAPGEHQA